MKKIILILAVVISAISLNAQVGINTDNSIPDPSAMLDVKSIDKGLLVPRMDSTQRKSIASPANGLLVYDTDAGTFYYRQQLNWIPLSGAFSSKDTLTKINNSQDHFLVGNSLGGGGKKMFYNANKAAFRMGFLNNNSSNPNAINFWDADSLGTYSFATGTNTLATGNNGAVATGFSTKASGNIGATAMGIASVASGNDGATALGQTTTASGHAGATAMGSNSVASGNAGATALGNSTLASGTSGSIAIGYQAKSIGNFGATAMGSETTASGDNGATSLGKNTVASGNDGATALGYLTVASGHAGATALGSHTVANGFFGSTAMGYQTKAIGSAGATAMGFNTEAFSNSAIVLGAGTMDSALVNNISQSFMVGFNSDLPTLFVGKASGLGTIGKVGIGTTIPNSGLHVKDGAIWVNGNGDGLLNAAAGSGLKMTMDALLGAQIFAYDYALGQAKNLILQEPGGNLGIGTSNPTHPLQMNSGAHVTSGGVWTSASDLSKKYDIHELNYGLTEVMKLRPTNYKYKIDDVSSIGFIAQEMEQIIPEIVSGEEGEKGIAYGLLTAVLVNALQEQQVAIEELKKDLSVVSAKNATLAKRMNKAENNLSLSQEFEDLKQQLAELKTMLSSTNSSVANSLD